MTWPKPYWVNPQREAAAQSLRAFKAATVERRRSRIWAEPGNGEPMTDVTEHIVSLLDMITTSMEWGSDFWSDTELPSFIELCRLLNFDDDATHAQPDKAGDQ